MSTLKVVIYLKSKSREGIRILTLENEIIPMMCGSAFKNKGVQPVLDSVLDYLPGPLDVPAVVGQDEDGQ